VQFGVYAPCGLPQSAQVERHLQVLDVGWRMCVFAAQKSFFAVYVALRMPDEAATGAERT